MVCRVIAGVAVIACAAASAWPARAQLPPGVYAGERSLKDATAGTYRLDPDHTAVIAKVSHIGYALSLFRFDKVEGTMDWNPLQPAQSKLTAVVRTISISTPVPGFAKELAGKGYLDAERYPDATFVSTAFRPVDATRGTVDGTLTLMGRTHPVTFEVALEGAGRGFMGHPRIGVTAKARIKPADYGLPTLFGPAIGIEIDAEFAEGS